MNWGKWITVAFVLFAAFIGSLVYVCVKQDIALVAPDYYQQELRYEEQISRIKNTSALEQKPLIELRGNSLSIQYSDLYKIQDGELKLFCPSNARLDQSFAITTTNVGVLDFNLDMLPPGMYKARMKWTQDGKEYFIEEIVNL